MSMWSEKVFRNSELQVCYIAKGNGQHTTMSERVQSRNCIEVGGGEEGRTGREVRGGGNIRHERVGGRKVGAGSGT